MAKFCSNCGGELSEGQDVCIKCGKYVNAKTEKVIDTNSKSKLVAGLLGIFVGSLGIHNFYLGYKNKAMTQLLLVLLTCGIGACITSIWGFIEGVMILTDSIAVDGEGKALRD